MAMHMCTRQSMRRHPISSRSSLVGHLCKHVSSWALRWPWSWCDVCGVCPFLPCAIAWCGQFLVRAAAIAGGRVRTRTCREAAAAPPWQHAATPTPRSTPHNHPHQQQYQACIKHVSRGQAVNRTVTTQAVPSSYTTVKLHPRPNLRPARPSQHAAHCKRSKMMNLLCGNVYPARSAYALRHMPSTPSR